MFATTYHTYVDPGNFTTTVVATETGSNTPSHIQESGLSAVTSVFDYALSVSPSRLPPVPAGVFSSTTATVTATVTAGTTQRIDLAACKGVCTDGNAFFKGIIVSFKPSFGSPPFTSIMTINVTATAPPGVYDITIGGSSNLVPERDTDIIIQVGALAANFGPTTTTVGVTNFVSKIVGGLKPFSCTWDFGDGSGSQTGCNPAHTYTASGNFTATLVVTDSDTPATTVTVTHFVVVEPNPRLVGRGIIAKAFISFGATELLKANVDNPSDFSEAVTVSIDIFRGPGIFVTRLSATVILGPVNSTQIVLTFTPATPGTYSFQAVLTYTTLVPVPPTNGATTPAVLGSTIVSGTGGTRSGTFTSG
jgi:PKD repeat protein